jgi:dTDP-4-amino-4,6-dideoxygalactose transaminase
LQPYYQGLGFKRGDFPVAEDYYARTITLPLYAGLLDDEQLHVIRCVQDFFNGLSA